MRRDSVLSLVGIAKKAGKIAAGEFQTEQAVKAGKACLVIVSEEASENTKKKFQNMCDFYKVPVAFYGGKEQLGTAIGCEFRASLAVTDEGLSRSIEEKLLQFTSQSGSGGEPAGAQVSGGSQSPEGRLRGLGQQAIQNGVNGDKKLKCEGRRYEYGED